MFLASVGRSFFGYGQTDLIHEFDEGFSSLVKKEKQMLPSQSKLAILVRYFMG
jgi:hypothetical protein